MKQKNPHSASEWCMPPKRNSTQPIRKSRKRVLLQQRINYVFILYIYRFIYNYLYLYNSVQIMNIWYYIHPSYRYDIQYNK